MAIWNAFILWKKTLPNIDNYDFRMNLVERILEKFHVTTLRSAKRQKLQNDCPLRLADRHFPYLVPSTSSKKNASRKCIVCSKAKVRRETRYQCNECDGSKLTNEVDQLQKYKAIIYIIICERLSEFVKNNRKNCTFP
ncbi:uncharacterized protein NPIL_387181 [Nephila pilipes]|uniref:PiggyBac transposable element-derived protein domain-containing protein n=1 Tax=Nephila pilipes TaxID=299642 RepID=A0A8X6IPM7_NEPPI|nr:uncharacterized protein NPIL_387181 [Nephila pilipes]